MRGPSRTTLVIGAVMGLATLGGAALASDAGPSPGTELRGPGDGRVHGEAPLDDDAAEQAALEELATVDRAGAEEAALASTGTGTVVESELEEEDGFVVWEVDVRLDDGSAREVEIDAGDARVLGSEAEQGDGDEDDDGDEEAGGVRSRAPGSVRVHQEALADDDAAEQAALEELATVDRAGAEEAALASTGTGTVVESELEEEDGFVVWEVDVRLDDGSAREVEIDAGDARVLGSEPGS